MNQQQSLFDAPVATAPPIYGVDVTPSDVVRLQSQYERVKAVMLDRAWHTLAEIADTVQGSQTSVSARLRDMRKAGFTVDRKRDEHNAGLWWYKVTESDMAVRV